MGDREGALARAKGYIDDGSFLGRLANLVSYETESHPPGRKAELERYCSEGLGSIVSELGFETEILPNPLDEHGPVLIAVRHEGDDLPTLLIYGHGDVVRAMPERWRSDLDPWTLKVEGDRIYGRGVVDNKGQHLLAIEALRAVLEERGSLGFNVKIFVETGEEAGSPGLKHFLQLHRERCAADVFLGLDGPRQSMAIPDITLGTRGGLAVDLVVNLRDGSHHSGHWGGLLKDPTVILAHAISTIISRDGRILVPGWTPTSVPASVTRASQAVVIDDAPGALKPDEGWGEPSLTRSEKIYAWSSAIVLASISGQPEAPVPAVPGFAKARIQLRHTVDVAAEDVVPALQQHLRSLDFTDVKVVPVVERDMFPPSRTDPEDAWVRRIAVSMTETVGRAPNIIPNIGASGPSEFFRETLGVPILWIPHSYGGCGQHGPDEHGLISLFREGLGIMAGVFWDVGLRSAAGSEV